MSVSDSYFTKGSKAYQIALRILVPFSFLVWYFLPVIWLSTNYLSRSEYAFPAILLCFGIVMLVLLSLQSRAALITYTCIYAIMSVNSLFVFAYKIIYIKECISNPLFRASHPVPFIGYDGAVEQYKYVLFLYVIPYHLAYLLLLAFLIITTFKSIGKRKTKIKHPRLYTC